MRQLKSIHPTVALRQGHTCTDFTLLHKSHTFMSHDTHFSTLCSCLFVNKSISLIKSCLEMCRLPGIFVSQSFFPACIAASPQVWALISLPNQAESSDQDSRRVNPRLASKAITKSLRLMNYGDNGVQMFNLGCLE